METSDQNTSPTVFDLPPSETESAAAPEFTGLLESDSETPQASIPQEAPTAAEGNSPWFTKYLPESEDTSSPEWKPSPPPTHLSKTSFELDQDEPPPVETASCEPETPAPAPTRTPTVRLTDDAPAQQPAPAPSARLPILNDEEDRATQLGLSPRPSSYLVTSNRSANQRRSTHLSRLIIFIFAANLLLLAAFGLWLYNRFNTEMEARLVSLPPGRTSTLPPTVSDDLRTLEGRLKSESADLKGQLQAAQKRLADSEKETHRQAAQIRELVSSLSRAEAAMLERQGTPAATPSATPSSTPTNPPEAELPPSQSELVILKERNRLTTYADEAIATGAREPYDRLWQAIDDPRLANLVHAARAEILRVQNFYLSGSRIDSYDIPVATYFPDSAALKDTQLKDEQLIELLLAHKNPWQVRMKAANLLGLRRSKAVGDALVKAVAEDPNLDVVKEATFSFEQMTGFRAKIFEPGPVAAWWQQYNAEPAPKDPAAAPEPPEEKKP